MGNRCELFKIGSLIDETSPAAHIAIVMSNETRWAYAVIIRTRNTMNPNTAVGRFHTALMSKNYVTDAFNPYEDLSQYKLVFAPCLYMPDKATSENLLAFVRNGGVLVLTTRRGAVDDFNKIRPIPTPGLLSGADGVDVQEYGVLSEPFALAGEIDREIDGIDPATFWTDEIVINKAQAITRYSEGWLKDVPAVTMFVFVTLHQKPE